MLVSTIRWYSPQRRLASSNLIQGNVAIRIISNGLFTETNTVYQAYVVTQKLRGHSSFPGVTSHLYLVIDSLFNIQYSISCSIFKLFLLHLTKPLSSFLFTVTIIMETKVSACEMITGYFFTEPESILEALNLSGQDQLYRHWWMRQPTNTRLAVYGDSVAARCLCSLWVKTSLSKGIHFRPLLVSFDKT